MPRCLKVALAAVLFSSLGLLASTADEEPCLPSGDFNTYDYKQVLCMSILFYEAQRSGVLPPDQRVTWRNDSALSDGADSGVDLTGGYYDAGDHVKFHFPLATALTILSWGVISYTEGYELAGQLEYAEATIRWGTDYLLKCNTANFTLFAQVGDGDLDHAFWGRPEDMTMERPSFKIDTDKPGSDLAGEAAAALAAASIVFAGSDAEYSLELLTVARQLFTFADEFRALYTDSLPEIGNFYISDAYGDELCWAAAWLYKATGEQAYADRAAELWVEFDMGQTPYSFDWNAKNAGAQLLYAELFGDAEYVDSVQLFADWIRSAPQTPLGLLYLVEWGTLRDAMFAAFSLLRAADLGIDPTENRAFAVQQAEYVVGSTGRSFVVGFGVDYPERPHHTGSSCPDLSEPCDPDYALNQPGPNPQLLYGGIVGGPDSLDVHTDNRTDYVHNEVALDYNAGLASVMAAMVTLGQ